jgi:hypothetical protein
MCPLCLSVAAVVGLVVARARHRKPAPNPTTWRLPSEVGRPRATADYHVSLSGSK